MSAAVAGTEPPIESWPEWTAYVADPSRTSLTQLCRRAPAPRPLLLEAMTRAFSRGGHWKIAQHIALLYSEERRLTEAWYFANLAVQRSNGEIHANLALAQVYEDRRLPLAALPLFETVRRQLRRLPVRERRVLEVPLAESFARVYAYLRAPRFAARWWLRVRRQPRIEVRTLIQLLLAAYATDFEGLAYETARLLAPMDEQLGPRVRVRVKQSLQARMLQVLRERP